MAAGLVTLNVLDGDGNTRTCQFWSLDGTTGGLLLPPTVVLDSTGAALDYTAASPVKGAIAAGSALSGNPFAVGGLAKTSSPTAVSDGQAVFALFDKIGRQTAIPTLRANLGRQVTTLTSTVTETTIVTAGGANVFLDLYGLILANTSASACAVTIRDVTSTGTATVIEVPANDTRGFMVGAGSAIPQGTANSAWTAQCGTSVASIKVTALYVKNS